jgi:hypothetical protein
MEKVVCLVWRPASPEPDAWRDTLRHGAASELRKRGATNITVFATDRAVDAGQALHLGPQRPDGMVSWWTEESFDHGPIERLEPFVERLAAYLVVESRPMIPAPPPSPGERSPDFVTVGCIAPAAGLSMEQFRDRWFNEHRRVAIETQSTTGYVRNEVVRALTTDAPAWAGIVEETFPLGALDDSAVFFDAVDDPERLADHQRRMFESVQAFLDLATVDSHPMSEYPDSGR